jgi:hypothetical protein
MSDREDRLRSLLDKVRGKRPGERETHAADALDRIRTASGTTAAAHVQSFPPPEGQSSPPVPSRSSAPPSEPTPFPSSIPTQVPSSPLPDPPTSPSIDSPTRYSSQPPQVERPLSVEPRTSSLQPPSGPPAEVSQSRRPEPIRPQSVAPTGQPVVYATAQPEFPRAKTFGELLELTLSLRPR